MAYQPPYQVVYQPPYQVVYQPRSVAVTMLALRDPGYVRIPSSEVIPELDLGRLMHHAMQSDQHAALRALRNELRGT